MDVQKIQRYSGRCNHIYEDYEEVIQSMLTASGITSTTLELTAKNRATQINSKFDSMSLAIKGVNLARDLHVYLTKRGGIQAEITRALFVTKRNGYAFTHMNLTALRTITGLVRHLPDASGLLLFYEVEWQRMNEGDRTKCRHSCSVLGVNFERDLEVILSRASYE